MTDTLAEALVKEAFRCYETRDRARLEEIMGDLRFYSPYDAGIDRAEYFSRCWPNADKLGTFEVVDIFSRQDRVCILYEATNKEGGKFRNTEWFKVKDGKIVEVDVYFGRKL